MMGDGVKGSGRHSFVMTTKKYGLLDRKVLKDDLNDPKNINKEMLLFDFTSMFAAWFASHVYEKN